MDFDLIYSLELRNSSHFLNLTTPVSHVQITHLRKFAQYTLVVKGHTRMGPGNHSSDPLNITTLEDGESLSNTQTHPRTTAVNHYTSPQWSEGSGVRGGR